MYGGFALFDHSLLTECPTSEKSDSLGPKLGAPYYGIIWGWGGGGNVNKHGGKRSGMFQRG